MVLNALMFVLMGGEKTLPFEVEDRYVVLVAIVLNRKTLGACNRCRSAGRYVNDEDARLKCRRGRRRDICILGMVSLETPSAVG